MKRISYCYIMPSDEVITRNIRMCIQLGMFDLIEQKDLELEVIRLTEKLERYRQCINEETDRVQTQLDRIKTFLK